MCDGDLGAIQSELIEGMLGLCVRKDQVKYQSWRQNSAKIGVGRGV